MATENQINFILQKISEVGLESLSPVELGVLQNFKGDYFEEELDFFKISIIKEKHWCLNIPKELNEEYINFFTTLIGISSLLLLKTSGFPMTRLTFYGEVGKRLNDELYKVNSKLWLLWQSQWVSSTKNEIVIEGKKLDKAIKTKLGVNSTSSIKLKIKLYSA